MEDMLSVSIEEANPSEIKIEEMPEDIPDGDGVLVQNAEPMQNTKTKSAFTNIQRYNVLVRAYIRAHPHLPRQMQYAEAQQVWREVRMDPEGAYMAVLRSLYGMSLIAQANETVAASDGAAPAVFEPQEELHPLMMKAIDPNYVLPVDVPIPPVLPSTSQGPQTSPQSQPVPGAVKKRIRIRKSRSRPGRPIRQGQEITSLIRRPGKRRGRPPKMKPVVMLPIVKRGPGRPRKNPLTPLQYTSIPISEQSPTKLIQADTSPKTLNFQTGIFKAPSSLIITPVASPPPQPTSNIPEPVEVTLPITPTICNVISLAPPEPPAAAPPTPAPDPVPKQEPVEQWEPQSGLSFVQGNGLKMILSRVNNGMPLPEYRRIRNRKKSPKSDVQKETHPAKDIEDLEPLNNSSPPHGQAADSTVMDLESHSPTSSQLCDFSPDQTFAAAILQYLLDLSELLGSATSFVISQETEQQTLNGPSNVSVYSGWLVGEQSIGPKLAASMRMSANTNELDCLSQLVNSEDFREVVRTPYGRVKPVAILILEGRKPGDLVDFLENIINCFKEWDLDSIILASQPAVGQHVLCTLENNINGNAVTSNGCHSSTTHQMKNKSIEVEQWKNRHVCSGQYYLQIAKCSDKNCCKEWRTPLYKILPPQGFLPPPVPFAKGEQGPIAPRFEERDMASYGRLCERLVMESLVPRTAFQKLPFDFYCPSARRSLSRQVCFDCGHYFCTQALRKMHSQLLHPNDDN